MKELIIYMSLCPFIRLHKFNYFKLWEIHRRNIEEESKYLILKKLRMLTTLNFEVVSNMLKRFKVIFKHDRYGYAKMYIISV